MKLNKFLFLEEIRKKNSFNFSRIVDIISRDFDQIPTDRTLRRWIHEFEQEGLIKKVGSSRSGNYEFIVKNAVVATQLDQSFFDRHHFASIDYVRQSKKKTHTCNLSI
jgi:hypothetical protein